MSFPTDPSIHNVRECWSPNWRCRLHVAWDSATDSGIWLWFALIAVFVRMSDTSLERHQAILQMAFISNCRNMLPTASLNNAELRERILVRHHVVQNWLEKFPSNSNTWSCILVESLHQIETNIDRVFPYSYTFCSITKYICQSVYAMSNSSVFKICLKIHMVLALHYSSYYYYFIVITRGTNLSDDRNVHRFTEPCQKYCSSWS